MMRAEAAETVHVPLLAPAAQFQPDALVAVATQGPSHQMTGCGCADGYVCVVCVVINPVPMIELAERPQGAQRMLRSL